MLIGVWLNAIGQQYPDSLLSYLEIAARNNPAVQQKFIEYEAALQKIPQVGSLSDPEFNIGVFLKPMEILNGSQVAEFRLMQMFPWFGVLKNAKDEMSLMANAKFELFQDARQQVFFEVQSTWFELYKVQKEIAISEKNIEILKVIERLALVRFKAPPSSNSGSTSSGSGISSGLNQETGAGSSSGMNGMTSGQGNSGSATSNQSASSMQGGSMGLSAGNSELVDLYRIQIEEGALENNIYLLESRLKTIIARFNSYLNRPPESPVFIGETLASDSLKISLTSVTDSILANNNMLGMLELEMQAFEARKSMVTRMGYPMVGLGLNYSLISKNDMASSPMNGKDMIMPMVTVTLPIYRKKYTAMINEAELLRGAAEQSYRSVSNSLQTEYYQTVQQYQDAQRRIELYESQFQLATKSFNLMLKGYSTSSTQLTDVLRVYQQTLDFELKKVEAVADFNTSIALLKRLMANTQIQ